MATVHDAENDAEYPYILPIALPSPIFTGRSEILDGMHEFFFSSSESIRRRVCVLHGLGGAGKSQIALRFLELNADR